MRIIVTGDRFWPCHQPAAAILRRLGDPAMKITEEILGAYLNCKTKGHLKLVGETGTKSDYEAMTEAASRASRELFLSGLVARYGEGNDYRGTAITAATLKQGAPMLADAILEDDSMSIRFDGLKRADEASKLGGHHYVPVLHNHGDKVSRQQKLLLAVLGLAPGSSHFKLYQR
jgi:hypothetical protein